MKLGKIIHLGIVVEDLEKAVKIYEETLGIGPWEIQDAREFFCADACERRTWTGNPYSNVPRGRL